MVSGSFTDECTSSIAVERLWKAGILDAHNLIPKIASDQIKSIEIIQGDGGVGTVKKFCFTEAVKPFSTLTDRVEVLDNEKHIFKYSIVEGGLIGLRLKSYSVETTLESGGDGSSVVKVNVEYETLDETDLTGDEKGMIKGGVSKMMKGVEAYLAANPDAYA
ncbi:major strawberry allergen Fra a 1-2-like [Typha angustifolia]|uniref:major strawberry allergen Fra a 1-2-like n=1 Tax=Typha angustifolia TaxID=59011 RepID=UPI003C2C7E72